MFFIVHSLRILAGYGRGILGKRTADHIKLININLLDRTWWTELGGQDLVDRTWWTGLGGKYKHAGAGRWEW